MGGAQLCRIEKWHGYIASSFYVRLPGGAVLESQPFRWRHAGPPSDDGAARAAYDDLVGRLEAAGWMRHADGTEWFATTFSRPAEQYDEHRVAQRRPDPIAPPPAEPPTRVAPRPRPEPPRVAVPAAAREQRPADAPPPVVRRGRWPPIAIGVAVAAVLAAPASALLLHGDQSPARMGVSREPAGLSPTAAPALPTTTNGVAGTARTAPVHKARLVDLRVVGHGRGSWLEIRRGSAGGPVLYSATLTDGQTLHFQRPRLWARFGAAANLTITVDGRPVQLQGTFEKVFVSPHSTATNR